MIAHATKRPPTLEEQLRVEVVDAGHRDWAAIRKHLARSGHADHLMELTPTGPLSARQSVVAAFLGGRMVGHACFRVEPTRTPLGSLAVVAKLDCQSIEPPFVGTSVEHVLMSLAHSRARIMGCHGITIDMTPRSQAA